MYINQETNNACSNQRTVQKQVHELSKMCWNNWLVVRGSREQVCCKAIFIMCIQSDSLQTNSWAAWNKPKNYFLNRLRYIGNKLDLSLRWMPVIHF